MSFLSKEELLDLYSSGSSMFEIAQKQQVSVHKVTYWMDKYGIKRRSRSEATYNQKNPNGDPFKVVSIDSQKKSELFALGVALYLGEGDKRSKWSVRFANSDYRIINLFLSFLIDICGLEAKKLHAWINIFNDRSYAKSLTYWSTMTNIPKIQFYNPIIRPRRVGTYKNKSKYGTITIVVQNKKLIDQIRKWSDEILDKYKPTWLSGKRSLPPSLKV